MTIALLGNPNTGKTALFNRLTGSRQHVGNFPGVTVEKKSGVLRGFPGVTVVDLPGIYALSPVSTEERVTRDFVLYEKPEVLIDIVDATHLERNLYLTLQLADLDIPTVVALNMMDEAAASGMQMNIDKLSVGLGVAVIPVSAAKNEGVSALAEAAVQAAQTKRAPDRIYTAGKVYSIVCTVEQMLAPYAKQAGIPPRFAAVKLVEGDASVQTSLQLPQSECAAIDKLVCKLEEDMGTCADAALANLRYAYIDKLCKTAVQSDGFWPKGQVRSAKIDAVLTNRYLAIPLFLSVMLLVFYFTFGVVGGLSDWFSAAIEFSVSALESILVRYGVHGWLISLITDGICAGIGSVLSFLPTVLALFFCLSLLEDSGYMARVAFVLDRPLRKLGLSGRAFVPMLLGFGCSVPAILSTRTLSSTRERTLAILFIPFMSCSAKMPIFAVFTAAFFPKHAALAMLLLYCLGVLMGILSALWLQHTLLKGESDAFVLELPPYRMPMPGSVLLRMWERAKDFLQRAFTLIFFASMLLWAFGRFDFTLHWTSDSACSLLAGIAKWLTPVFRPLGFGRWEAVTALVTGLAAKETVVSTFAVLNGVDIQHLAPALSAMFTPLQAISFLVFTLLYMPCVASVAAVRRELGSWKRACLAMLYQTGFAWIAAFLVYSFGLLFAAK